MTAAVVDTTLGGVALPQPRRAVVFHPAQFPHNRKIPHNSRRIPANSKS